MSMHLPLMRIVLSGPMVQFCWALPSQPHITIFVSFAAESSLSSTHVSCGNPRRSGRSARRRLGSDDAQAALAPESPTVVWATTVTLYVACRW